MEEGSLKLSDYDYVLPPDRIAQTPLTDRAASKLLILKRETGEVTHRQFREVPDILHPTDLLVLNDTRVSALRLFGQKPEGGQVEALVLAKVEDEVYECLLKPAKRCKPGTQLRFSEHLFAEVLNYEDGPLRRVRFISKNYETELLSAGVAPLPPYIRESLQDTERYQTVYNKFSGSAAAPTAGLHFTTEILESLRQIGVKIVTVTLHVGLDTFRPVEAETLINHVMHGEHCEISTEAADQINAHSGRIIAVGTTSVRTLESFAVGKRKVESGQKQTQIFIYPGFEYLVVDGMFTNFHMPRTTMLMMLSSLAGRKNVMAAYEEALKTDYRFLSFGDSMLIF